MWTRLLFATDGSDYAETGLRQMALMAERLRATLDVLHVTDTRQVFFPFAPMASGGLLGDVQLPAVQGGVLRETLELRAREVLDRARSILEETGVAGRVFARDGSPVATILEASRDYDLLMLGKKGIGHGWSDDDIGSTVEKVVRRAEVPVLITSARPRAIEKALWAYDASPIAERMLEVVPSLCAALKIPLTLLSVSEDEDPSGERETVLERPARIARQHGLEPDRLATTGYPEEEIIHHSRRADYTLIALGAYGHHRVVEFFLGSVARVVLRLSEVPVLLLRETD